MAEARLVEFRSGERFRLIFAPKGRLPDKLF